MKDSRANFRCPVSKPTMTKPLLEVFRKDLADQITFLGSDLTPTAMTALKPATRRSTRPRRYPSVRRGRFPLSLSADSPNIVAGSGLIRALEFPMTYCCVSLLESGTLQKK